MTFTVLTYNVLFNRAFPKLEKIFAKYNPDIVCLQEVDTSEKNLIRLEKYGYQLADYSNSLIKFGKIFGIATYYKSEKIILTESDSFDLPKSFYELILTGTKLFRGGSRARTILRTDFKLRNNSKKVAVYNIHLSLYGMNRTRKIQLQKVLDHDIKHGTMPTIITGDFNYFPYRRKTLEDLMNHHGYLEATKSIAYTLWVPDRNFARYSFLQELGAKLVRKYFNNKLKPDYSFYRNLTLIKTERVKKLYSDHYPIISTFETPTT